MGRGNSGTETECAAATWQFSDITAAHSVSVPEFPPFPKSPSPTLRIVPELYFFKGGPMNYANPHLLWSVDELKSRLHDPKLALMDMRPPEAYSNGHIPGARSFDIFGISLIDTRPEPLNAYLWMIEHLIQAKGVNND